MMMIICLAVLAVPAVGLAPPWPRPPVRVPAQRVAGSSTAASGGRGRRPARRGRDGRLP